MARDRFLKLVAIATAAGMFSGLFGVGGGTIRSTPHGILCGVICRASFRRGTGIVLVARPGPHFTLQRWSGACSGDAPRCTVRLTGPTAAVAIFMPNCTRAENGTAPPADPPPVSVNV